MLLDLTSYLYIWSLLYRVAHRQKKTPHYHAKIKSFLSSTLSSKKHQMIIFVENFIEWVIVQNKSHLFLPSQKSFHQTGQPTLVQPNWSLCTPKSPQKIKTSIFEKSKASFIMQIIDKNWPKIKIKKICLDKSRPSKSVAFSFGDTPTLSSSSSSSSLHDSQVDSSRLDKISMLHAIRHNTRMGKSSLRLNMINPSHARSL